MSKVRLPRWLRSPRWKALSDDAVFIAAVLVVGWAGTQMWAAYQGWQKKFGAAPGDSRGDWGTYGDYLGGLVGTYASVVTLVLVALTYWQQSKQLKHAKEQGVREELQRLVA